MKIALVGDSLLSLFLALELDKTLAQDINNEVTYITNDSRAYYWPRFFSFKNFSAVDKSVLLSHLKLKVVVPKSINLQDRQIITADGVSAFDQLIVDFSPTYTTKALVELEKRWRAALAKVHLESISGSQASVTIQLLESHPINWQLALAMQSDLDSTELLGRIRIKVTAENDKLKNFLSAHGLNRHYQNHLQASLEAKGFKSVLPKKSVKPIFIGLKGKILTDEYWRLSNNANVFVIDDEAVSQTTLARPLANFARRFIANLAAAIDNTALKPLDYDQKAYLLQSNQGRLLNFFEQISTKIKAAAIAKVDRQFWNKLQKSQRR